MTLVPNNPIDLIEHLIENPEYLTSCHKEVRYKDIYKFLMYRPEYHNFFNMAKLSLHSWEMILSEQPQMINLYIEIYSKMLQPSEMEKRIEHFKEMFDDIQYYL